MIEDRRTDIRLAQIEEVAAWKEDVWWNLIDVFCFILGGARADSDGQGARLQLDNAGATGGP